MNTKSGGFTIVEIVVTVVIIGILAGATMLTYNGVQSRATESVMLYDLSQATDKLEVYRIRNNSYPHNLAGAEFSASPSTAITLYTNAPTVGVYGTLTSEQNAQLLLNVCNAVIYDLSSVTACEFSGKKNGAKIHVKGTGGSNTHWRTPIDEEDIVLSCGPECDAAVADIKSQFEQQGGTYPITVNGNTAEMPDPTLQPNGTASRYCIEVRSARFSSLQYYATDEDTNHTEGTCPDDPELSYFP